MDRSNKHAGSGSRYLHTSIRDGIVVARLEGVADAAFQGAVGSHLRRLGRGVEALVLDLDHLTLVHAPSLHALLDAALAGEAPVAIVCRRRSGRRQLRRWGVVDHLPVYGTVEDALQARIFEQAGYGGAWAGRTRPWWTGAASA